MEKPSRECPRRCQCISQIHSRADLRYQQSMPLPSFFRILVISVLSITWRQMVDTIRKVADQTAVNSEQLEQFIQM